MRLRLPLRAKEGEIGVKRRTIFGALAGLIVFGAVIAMAASLGGITSGRLGADDTTIFSCDTDGIATNYASSWDATDERYEVTGVTVSGIANLCDGQTLSVSLTDTGGAQLGSGSIAIPADGTATSVTVSLSTAASAELAVGVHVVIA
jgi:hypothetical protein